VYYRSKLPTFRTHPRGLALALSLHYMLQLHQVLPYPLVGLVEPQTQVWQTECSFLPGQRYIIYAPSGKGKSTFTGILFGTRTDYTGEATLDGKDLRSLSVSQWADIRQSQLSIVFQDLRLLQHRTARENLNLKAQLYGPPNQANINNYAERLGISNLLDRAVYTLSYGERQRVAIIRALLQPFRYLLLDEPFSHLDLGNQLAAAELLGEVAEAQQASILLTSLAATTPLSAHHTIRL
jgi:ABC-type lipoprotein export system ATPase subunit